MITFLSAIKCNSTGALHCRQKPPAPRNVGTPLSALTPAPLRTTICFALAKCSRNAVMSELGLDAYKREEKIKIVEQNM